MTVAAPCIVSRLLRPSAARPRKAWREPDGSWIVVAGEPEELRAGFDSNPTNWDPAPLSHLLTKYPALSVLASAVGDEIEWDPITGAYVERTDAFTCVVSRWVFEPDGSPLHARREEPVDERDSGWCFLAGASEELEEGFGDGKGNWRRITLADLIERFPKTEDLFAEPVGSELEWDPVAEVFRLSYVL